MGFTFSKEEEASAEKEKAIKQQIEDWLHLRDKTIAELSRVANELDSLYKKATYSKIAGGVAGALGGGIALAGLALTFFTGGTSLFLTGSGLTIAAGGGVTATVAEVVEYIKNKTKVDAAQKALEEDKKVQAALLEKIKESVETSDIDAEVKSRFQRNLQSFVDGVQRLWISGVRIYRQPEGGLWMYSSHTFIQVLFVESTVRLETDPLSPVGPWLYGLAKSSQAIYSTVKWVKAGNSIWKYGATQGLKRTLMSVGGGLAGSVFMLVDLGYVIHHAIQIKKGNPSDAARSIRRIRNLLITEKERILAITATH